MYIPKSFREEDPALLHDLMQRYNFAALVTQHEGALFATHLPFMLDTQRGPHGTLLAHMARANPQWQDFADGREALVIFQGAHTYISPAWCEVAPSVPTWNYAVIHAYGVPQVIEDRDRLYAMLESLVDTHEAARIPPWRMELPDDYVDRMLRAIVGFEIQITRLEGKLKLSQNRPEGDRRRVVAELAESDDSLSLEVAEMMRARE
jgi:transcriptional regulator